MHAASIVPPLNVDVRRPHLSANKNAGIVMSIMSNADIPDARKDDSDPLSPACWNKSGA